MPAFREESKHRRSLELLNSIKEETEKMKERERERTTTKKKIKKKKGKKNNNLKKTCIKKITYTHN